jgi:hypothetical protein
METPNANKICNDIGGYMYCKRCPLFSVCDAEYSCTEEFEKAIENAAIEHLKRKDNGNAI